MSFDNGREPHDKMLERGLYFFGRITASVSHELNNVISIMDQTTGLLEDALAGAHKGTPVSEDMLKQVVGSLQRQAERGLGIIRRLNRFSHSADLPVTEFDINEALENLIELNRRFAVLKKVTLESQLSDTPLKITGNPFFLQQVLFESIQSALSVSQKDAVIKVTSRQGGDYAEVSVEFPVFSSGSPEWNPEVLQPVLDHMSARLEVSRNSDRTILRFSFPEHR
jgi:signal transduction histidine kinase